MANWQVYIMNSVIQYHLSTATVKKLSIQPKWRKQKRGNLNHTSL